MNELGLGVSMRADGLHAMMHVGTQLGNPDDVLARFQDILDTLLDGDESGTSALAELARSHPDTPLGRSYRAGTGSMGTMAMPVGVLAAVAIPAFMTYTKLSRSTEARQFVKKLYDGARAYHMEPPQEGLKLVKKHFPGPSAGPTPPLGACCAAGGKCAPDASQWDQEPWISLQFSVDDPHYYSYQYEVVDAEKEFVVRAFGDLDCDGEYSTFEMRGAVDDSGAVASPEGMIRIRESE